MSIKNILNKLKKTAVTSNILKGRMSMVNNNGIHYVAVQGFGIVGARSMTDEGLAKDDFVLVQKRDDGKYYILGGYK